jgi:hypothetical protein
MKRSLNTFAYVLIYRKNIIWNSIWAHIYINYYWKTREKNHWLFLIVWSYQNAWQANGTYNATKARTTIFEPEPRMRYFFLTVLHANFSALLFRLLEHKDAETTFFFKKENLTPCDFNLKV